MEWLTLCLCYLIWTSFGLSTIILNCFIRIPTATQQQRSQVKMNWCAKCAHRNYSILHTNGKLMLGITVFTCDKHCHRLLYDISRTPTHTHAKTIRYIHIHTHDVLMYLYELYWLVSVKSCKCLHWKCLGVRVFFSFHPPPQNLSAESFAYMGIWYEAAYIWISYSVDDGYSQILC